MTGLRSIRNRTFALFVVPSFILVIIGALLGYQRVAARAIDGALNEATAATAATAAEFSGKLGRLAQQAEATAAHVSLDAELPSDDDLFDLLEANVRSEPLIFGAAFGIAPSLLTARDRLAPYVFRGDDGLQRIDIGVDSYDYTLPEWEWYAGPAADRAPRWTAPYFDTDAGGIVMVTYSTPMEINGAFAGVATVDVAMSALPEALTVDVPANLRLLVLDESARVVWDSSMVTEREPQHVAEVAGTSPDARWIRQTLAERPGAIELPDGAFARRHQTALYAPISLTPWHLVAILDRDAILSEVRRESVTWSGAGLIAFLMLGLVAWQAAGSSTRRMKELAQQATALAAGDFDVRVDEPDDELGEVAKSLNGLGRQLADRAAVARAARQRRFGDLVETSPRGTLLVGRDDRVVYANTAAMALLSPRGRSMEGRSVRDLVSIADLPILDETTPTVRRGHHVALGPISVITDEGREIPVDANVAVVGATDDDLLTVLSFRDLREELRVNQSNAERERFLAGIFQNAGVGIVVTDPDGTIRDANVTFREYVGRDLVTLLGQPFADLIHPDDRDEGGRVVAALGRGALNGFVTEHRYLRPGGMVSWGEARSAALRDANDEVERIIIAVSDLTARRRANATFRAVFEHSDDGYVIIRRNQIDDANGAALRLFGVERKGQLESPLFGPAHAPESQPSGLPSAVLGPEILESAWAGKAYRGEWDVLRPDGTVTTVSLTLVPIQVGDDDALLAVMHDLSQRKQFEAELVEARDAAESAARAKADFLATMSHEIRTPMNGVIGMVDLLAESRLSADQQRMINTTKDSALALLAIINDVLDFSKIEAGKLHLEAVPVGVHELGDAVTEMLATNAANAGLSLQAIVEDDVPEAFVGDPVRLRQILFNLVGNAIKFTKSGGVTVRTSRASSDDGPMLVLSVEDTGIGMTQEQVGRLFQPFTQAESSTTRQFGGTGLGLSIVSRIVDLMDGTVTIESTPGAGSTFRVQIPLEEATWPSGLPSVEGLGILACVADSPEREALIGALTRGGADVAEVTVDGLTDLLRHGDAGPDVIYLGSGMDPVDRVRLRGLGSTDPAARRIAFVAGQPAGASTQAPELPDTTLVVAAPLSRLGLFHAVGVATGRVVPAEQVADEQVKNVTRRMAIDQGQLLLVAEDNRTNQEVIRRQLLMLGYWADIVSDGAEAIEALGEAQYAALLTDCHMPHVDGFELTRHVREREERLSLPRMPIVAITANALQGEGARCLAEGMDDYLTKPLEMPRLTTSLLHWVGPAAGVVIEPQEAPATQADVDGPPRVAPLEASLPTLDATILETTLRGDRATARLLLADFVPNARELVDGAKQALGERDKESMVRAGHTLKSSARAVGAMRLGAACDALELRARSTPVEEMAPDVVRLAQLFDELSAAVAEVLAEPAEGVTS